MCVYTGRPFSSQSSQRQILKPLPLMHIPINTPKYMMYEIVGCGRGLIMSGEGIGWLLGLDRGHVVRTLTSYGD